MKLEDCEALINNRHHIYLKTLTEEEKVKQELQNSKFYYIYKLLILKEALLIKQLAGDDDRIFTYFSIYYYLLWNGLLSKDGKFIFNDGIKCPTKLFGSSVIFGRGVCSNIATHFTEILKELKPDVEIFTIGTYVDENDNIKLPSTRYITKSISFSNPNSQNSELEKNGVNHAETFVKSNGFWILDTTNFRINKLIFDDNDYGRKFYDMRVPSLFDFEHFSGTPEEVLSKMEKSIRILYKSINHSISLPRLITIRDYGIKRCIINTKLIEYFRKDNIKLYRQLVDEQDKILKK